MTGDSIPESGTGETLTFGQTAATESQEPSEPSESPIPHTTLEASGGQPGTEMLEPDFVEEAPEVSETSLTAELERWESGSGSTALKLGAVFVVLILLVAGAFYLFFAGEESKAPAEGEELALNTETTGTGTDSAAENTSADVAGTTTPEAAESTPETDGAQPAAAEEGESPSAEQPRRNDDRDANLTEAEKRRKAKKYYKKGKKAHAHGNLNKAIKYFKLAKKFNPNSAPLYKKLGMIYMMKGQNKRAKTNFKKYLRLAPQVADAARIRELVNSL